MAIDQRVLNFPGVPGNYLSTPDTATNSVVVTAAWEFELVLPSNTPGGAVQIIMSKDDLAADRAWAIGFNTNGFLFLTRSTDGSTITTYTASQQIPIAANGDVLRLYMSWSNSTGSVIFYYHDGSNWVKLGATIAGATTATFDSSAAVVISGYADGSSPFTGRLLKAHHSSGTSGPPPNHGSSAAQARAIDWTTNITFTDGATSGTPTWTGSATATNRTLTNEAYSFPFLGTATPSLEPHSLVAGNTYVTETLPAHTLVAGSSAPIFAVPELPPYELVGIMSGEAYVLETLPGHTSTGELVTYPSGVLDAQLPLVTGAFTGGVYALSAELPRMTSAMVGSPSLYGGMSSVLPSLTSAISGNATIIGELSARLYALTSEFVAIQERTGALAGRLYPLHSAMVGAAGAAGTMSAQLITLRGALTGYYTVYGAMSVTLPRISAAFGGTASTTYLTTFVVNVTSAGLSQYSNYGFNSFASFQGMELAAGSDGIYQVATGDLDQTTPIQASWETGNHDFGIKEQKRLADVYAAYRASGDLMFSVRPDEGLEQAHRMNSNHDPAGKVRKVNVGKGEKARYWKLGVENVDGADFQVDSVEVAIAPSRRRV